MNIEQLRKNPLIKNIVKTILDNDKFYESCEKSIKEIYADNKIDTKDIPIILNLSNDLRLANANLLKKLIENILSSNTSKYWIKKIEHYGVPVGKVNNIKEALELEQVKVRNMLVDVKLNKSNKLKIAGNPIKISGFIDSKIRKKAPSLDQDRESILREFKIKE